MAEPRRPRRVLRHLRRVPGYRYARRALVPRIRRSPTARAVVHRIFAVEAKQRTPMDVAAGNLLAGVGVEGLPVVVVVLAGVPAERIDVVVADVAALQVLTAAFRPVFVMDTPRLAAARTYGYPVELLADEATWTDPQPWSDYAQATLRNVFAAYRNSASVVIGPEGLSPAHRLVLSSLHSGR